MDVSDGRGRYHSFSGINTDKTVMDNFEAPFLGLDQFSVGFDFGHMFLLMFCHFGVCFFRANVLEVCFLFFVDWI